MRKDIVGFISMASRRLGGLEAYYIPENDVYVVTKNGKAVQNFTSNHFYQQPKYFRLREWGAMIRVGLNHNMGEKSVVNQIHQVRGIGKEIILNGNRR